MEPPGTADAPALVEGERPPSLEERVARAVAVRGLWAPDQPLLVGCSGGADSTCLLALVASLRRSAGGRAPLHAVYVDHGLRAGTDEEARLVAGVAEQLGAGFERVGVTVSRRGNLLAAARQARYRALSECARRRGISSVAIGHTATDQAETVAFRRLRGDPQEARAGMPIARALDGADPEPVRLIRPLLAAGVSRDEAAAWVRQLGLPTVEDPSNDALRFTRVRLRAELVREGEPVVSRLVGEAALHADQLLLDEAEAEALGSLDALDAPRLAAARPAVLLRLLRRAGLFRAGRAQVEALAALAAGTRGSACIDLGVALAGRDPSARAARGEPVVAERRYRTVRIGPPLPAPADEAVRVQGPGRYPLLGRTFEVVELGPGEAAPMVHAMNAALVNQQAAGRTSPPHHGSNLLDGSLLEQPLLLRNLRPGDRWRGALGGRRLSRVLIDLKVPRSLRRGLALLAPADGGDVVWVEGLGASVAARAQASSPRRFLVRAVSPSEKKAEGEGGDG